MKAAVVFVVFAIVASLGLAGVVSGPSVAVRSPACPTPTPPTAVDFTNFNAEYKNGVGLVVQVQSVMDLELVGVQFAYKDGSMYGRLIGSPIPAQYPGMPVSGAYMEILTAPQPSQSPCFVVNYWTNYGTHEMFDPAPNDCAHPQD